MLLSELFVRVRGDTSDVTSKLAGVQRSMAGLEGASRSGTLHLGKLGNSFEALASRIAGVNPVVGKLAGVLGDFSIGAATTVGVLAGVAAVAVVYDKLTESSRKAMAAADKLAESYNQLAKIHAFGSKEAADIDTINKGLEQHNKWLGFIIAARAQLGPVGGLLSGFQGGHSDAITAGTTAKAAAEQERVNQIGLQNARDNEAFAARVRAANEKAAADAKKAEEAAQRYREMMLRAYGPDAPIRGPRSTWVSSPQSMTDDERAALMAANGPGGVGAVDISDSVKIANDQAKKINDEAERHAQMIHDAIWGSAAQLANSIVSALNIGGGGRGSSLGGAIGSTAGFALGMTLTGGSPIGGAIGSTIGNIAGSLFGGLFDHHTKAVNANTAAVNANTAALLLNAPSGYKVGSARFDATQTIKQFQRDAIRYNTRGGAPVMVTR